MDNTEITQGIEGKIKKEHTGESGFTNGGEVGGTVWIKEEQIDDVSYESTSDVHTKLSNTDDLYQSDVESLPFPDHDDETNDSGQFYTSFTLGILKRPNILDKFEKKIMMDEDLQEIFDESDLEDLLADGDSSDEESDEEMSRVVFVPGETPEYDTTLSPSVVPTAPFNSSYLEEFPWFDERPNVPPIHFSGNTGMLNFPTSEEPIDFFLHIFTEKFFRLIMRETNLQGTVLAALGSKYGFQGWKPLTKPELEIFLGLIFLSGHYNAPTISHHWQVSSLYNFPIFRNAMSRDRFFLIFRALHFAKTSVIEDSKPTDPLYKISPLYNLFHERMKEIYYPTKELTMEESVLLCEGKVHISKNSQKKCQKFGLKFHTLTEPDGVVLKLRIYCGANDTILGKSRHRGKIVKLLLHEFLGRGHTVYLDERFSSVSLSNYLLRKSTHSLGLLCPNTKGNPLHIEEKVLNKGEIVSTYSNTGLCVLKWHNNPDFLVISSEFGPKMCAYRSRSGKCTDKPESVIEYWKVMGGANRSDQLMSYYPCEEDSIRWYAKAALHLFHTILYNAFIMYKQQPGKSNTNLLDFRESVIYELIYRNRKAYATPPKRQEIHVISQLHPNRKNRLIRKICAYCSRNKRVETSYYCDQCEEKPGLCLEPCFKKYHSY